MAASSEGSAAACAQHAAEKLIIKRDGEECGRREEHWTEAIISLVMTIKSHPKC